MADNVTETIKVEYRDGWWVVLLASPVVDWIVGSEHRTEAEANDAAKEWANF